MVVDRGMKRSHVDRGGMVEEVGVGGEGEELIYNVDYHGVSTHPPSPKHPHP